MAGKRMSQHVRMQMQVDALADGPFLKSLLNTAWGDPPATATDENGIFTLCNKFVPDPEPLS